MAKAMRNVLLLAKIETPAGTDANPVANADAILARVTNPQPAVAQFADRNVVRPYFGNSGKIQVMSYSEMEIEVELASAGTAGSTPKWDPLLQACAFGKTTQAGVSVTYAPVSTSLKTITLYYYLDGHLHKMLGCRGDVTFELSSRSIPMMKFKFTGFYQAPTDVAVPSGADFTGFKEPFAVNKLNTPTGTIHGVTGAMESVSISMNNQIAYRNLIGFEDVVLTDRNPSGNTTIEMTSVATKAWHEIVRLGTLNTMQIIHGVGAGNIIQFDAPKVGLTDPTYSDSDGVVMLGLGLQFQPNTGNDELVMVVK